MPPSLPTWVVPPRPAASIEEKAQNASLWLQAIEAVEHSACPIWNRAFRLACDIGPPLDTYGPHLDNGSLAEAGDALCEHYAALFASPAGDELPRAAALVYVPTLSLPAFVSRVLPRVPVATRIVLVTGLADWGPARVFGTGSVLAGRAACEALLFDTRVVAWWAEMLDFGLGGTAGANGAAGPPKPLFALPLGVDLHTLAFKPADRPAWGPPAPPLHQVAQLWAAARAAHHSDARVYTFFGIRNRRRLAVCEVAQALPRVFALDCAPPGSVERTECWTRMGAHEWTACVQGYGEDCHRTWEVLALGGGVVVEDMPLTRRFLEGLPALFVDSGGEGAAGHEERGAARTRGSFSRAWRGLAGSLPALKSVVAAAKGAPCPGLQRLAASAAAGPPLGAVLPLLGQLALMLQDAGRSGVEPLPITRAPPPEPTLTPPASLNPLLLASTWLRAMRQSAWQGCVSCAAL